MRKPLILLTVLVGMGLGVFLSARSGGPGGTEERHSAKVASTAGTTPRPKSPEAMGAHAGSTPSLAQVPTQEDGALEVEVVASEQPVPGASVRLYWRGARDPSLDEVSWWLASTGLTDAKGRVRLASRPGSYLVAVHARSHAVLRRDVVRPLGEALTHLRLTLEAGQSLTGRTVARRTNEPLPLVELVLTAHGLELEDWRRADAPAEERVYASSDERGNFRVDGLASGDYQVEARAPGYAGTVLHHVKVPAVGPLTVALQGAGVIEGFVEDARGRPASGAEVKVSGSTPQVVTTGEGGGFSVEVEAGLHVLSARRGDEAGSLDKPVVVSAGKTARGVRLRLGPGATLEGRVVAKASGAPVAGAHVDVSPLGNTADSGRAVTDEAGHFSVSGLAPGSYDVVVNAPGFAQLIRRGPTVAPGERFRLELQLTGSGAVEGHVRDAAGQPVAGALVVGGKEGNAPAETRTNAEGAYRIEGLSTGNQYFRARREEASLGTTRPVEVTEGGTARLDFTLEETGTVEGVVRAASGTLPSEPLSVKVFAMDQNGDGTPDMSQTGVDAAGNFRLTLPAGSYRMHARLPQRPSSAPLTPKLVQVEAGKTVRAELLWKEYTHNEYSVQGIVLEPDGMPSPGAQVSLNIRGWSFPMTVLADEEGRFTFYPHPRKELSEARATVGASNGTRSGESSDVRLGKQDVVVKLRTSATVRGRVVRTSGQPVRKFSLLSQPLDWAGSIDHREGEFQGDRFELRDVPATPTMLVARTEDGARGEARITPGHEASAEVVLTLKAAAGIRGRVVEEDTKQPVANAYVSVKSQSNGNLYERSSPDGRFLLEGLAAGEYSLQVAIDTFRSIEREVALVEGKVLDLGDLALPAPRTSAGTIGAYVSISDDEPVFFKVVPGSPAARAGLRIGDTLLAVDGTPVTDGHKAFQLLHGEPGSTVVLEVRSAGTVRTVSVTRAP
ncbi:carboxypeptidase regulatory-like domain-containing protein [Archangium lipolyticum]|uniref:carboxypeptidase regulatory-like domain-containing protein n=1 Tax=Archangium lipolyticum TaxID=2970465 RepID=UPI002149F21F|nr:carboxypeptidase regulatory-like domain-containing protein [Archangium lipolyticum]